MITHFKHDCDAYGMHGIMAMYGDRYTKMYIDRAAIHDNYVRTIEHAIGAVFHNLIHRDKHDEHKAYLLRCFEMNYQYGGGSHAANKLMEGLRGLQDT